MSYISNCRWAMQETCRAIRREPGRFFFSTVLTGLALAVPLFIAVVFYGLSEPLRNIPLAVEIPVFTDGRVPAETLAKSISSVPGVAGTMIIPKEKAFAELNTSLGIKPKSKNARNPLPDIIIVTMASNVDSDTVREVAEVIEEMKGVDLVSVETSWHDRLGTISRAVNTGLAIIGVAVLALVVLAIMGTLRSTGRNADEEMRTLHLFGASPVFAVRPTAWRGALMMFASSLTALGLTSLGLFTLSSVLAEVGALYHTEITLSMPTLRDCAVFIIFCTVAGGIVASFAALDAWRRVR